MSSITGRDCLTHNQSRHNPLSANAMPLTYTRLCEHCQRPPPENGQATSEVDKGGPAFISCMLSATGGKIVRSNT